ncbi:long-chain fatty acid--CoA ligase [Alicyclobacillus sp.]|uniref:long-chain fatty acid--CoA ligase n=1 Tax=Alicyclobacillus sp. TaxID=61169 RepID=UPI0025C67825|nr:long-chain fatty acid--CoA ligase [Alicyclobacillus sp.]MCL6516820.1 long-chain fatty acid--CoA ligase [Alicyclobacillus sp.]
MSDRHFEFWPKDVPKSLTVPRTTLFDNLEVSARRYPDKAAIHFYGRAISYGELHRDVNALAGFLQEDLGVRQGDRVLLYMQNSPSFIVAYYAILRADAVVVPVNPMNVTEELQFYIEDAQPKVAIVGQELYPRIQPLVGRGTLERVVVAAYSDYLGPQADPDTPDFVTAPRAELADASAVSFHQALGLERSPAPSRTGPDDLAVLPYTSGTTGRPKGCMHTHATVQANTVGGVVWSSMTQDAVVLATLPLFHVTGMVHSMHAPIYCGSTIVLMTRWNRDLAGRLIARHQCTGWINISTMVVDFLANPNLGQYDLSSLKRIGGGGAPLPQAVGERLFELTGLRYAEGYGLSETISQTHSNPPDRPKMQCAGIPVFDVDARVIDPETLRELGPREEGEIVVAGPQVFLGYWRRPEETERAFVQLDGKRFFRTGDIGYVDEEGYFFIVDRLKRMINASGFKVWPTEVESILFRHPAVEQACVIGVPDPRRGETVKAYIVLRPEARGQVSEEDIIEWSREHMAAYKRPRIIQFVDALPLSGTGKVMWRLLQEEERRRYQQAQG